MNDVDRVRRPRESTHTVLPTGKSGVGVESGEAALWTEIAGQVRPFEVECSQETTTRPDSNPVTTVGSLVFGLVHLDVTIGARRHTRRFDTGRHNGRDAHVSHAVLYSFT